MLFFKVSLPALSLIFATTSMSVFANPMKKGKKSKKGPITSAPTTGTQFEKYTFRTVGTGLTTIDAFTGFPNSTNSFVGGRSVITSDIYLEDQIEVNGDGNLVVISGDPIGSFAQACVNELGVFPVIKTTSCSSSFCFVS
jgi:hypothetical protein